MIEQGFEKVEKKKTEERTIDELLQALHDGEPMTDMADIQKQIDDAMQNLPEGYENLFPEGFDISSIFGGY